MVPVVGNVLMCAKLDRLTRSLLDFAALMERSLRERWSLVAVDLGVDTTTAGGQLVANVVASVAEWERRQIGERTPEALAVKRSAGVPLGRPATMPGEVRLRIARERLAGRSLNQIADRLNGDGHATAQGGRRWYGSTVAKALTSGERA